MVKKMKLPIVIKPFVTSECFTFSKFAVMQNSPSFPMWAIRNFKLYLDIYGESSYGEIDSYGLSHFENFLDIKDCKMLNVSIDKFIDYIIDKIDNGYYIIVDVDYNFLINAVFNLELSEPGVHEVLIYGYDNDKKVFFVPVLYKGIFREVTVDFNILKKAYSVQFTEYQADKSNLFFRRYYFFGMTAIKIKDNYSSANIMYDFIVRLGYEAKGKIVEISDFDENEKLSNTYKYSTGVSCLKYLSNIITNYILYPEEFNIYKILNSCLKISEYHNILYSCIEWFLSQFNIIDNILLEKINEYHECCKKAEQILFMSEKYKLTQKKELLVNISKKLEILYKKEKPLFVEIANLAQDICIELE